MSTTLRKFGLFRHASHTQVCPPDTTIFREGDEGHVMYAIKRGQVAIVVEGKRVDTLEARRKSSAKWPS
jgi:hypothetical protein